LLLFGNQLITRISFIDQYQTSLLRSLGSIDNTHDWLSLGDCWYSSCFRRMSSKLSWSFRVYHHFEKEQHSCNK